jgi:hypothetical protein
MWTCLDVISDGMNNICVGRHGCLFSIEGKEFLKGGKGKRTLKIHSEYLPYFFNAVNVPHLTGALHHIHTCHM